MVDDATPSSLHTPHPIWCHSKQMGDVTRIKTISETTQLFQLKCFFLPGDVGRAPNFAIAEQNPGWVGLVAKEFTLGGK